MIRAVPWWDFVAATGLEFLVVLALGVGAAVVRPRRSAAASAVRARR